MTPPAFYKVIVCPQCNTVLLYKVLAEDEHGKRWVWRTWTHHSNGMCSKCGSDVMPKEEEEQTAAWYATWKLLLPWTWGAGHWVLRKMMPPDEIVKLTQGK